MNLAIRQLRNRRRDASGQVLVLFALMLVVLLLASALAVDYGGWLVAKRNQQNVSDAAALAGAQQLTRPLTNNCPSGASKAVCARQAAWQVINSSLGLGLTPAAVVTLGLTSTTQNSPTALNGYKIWVDSPPSDAGTNYLGHTSGPGNVYVRIDHPGQTYLSSIVGVTRSVAAWSTAGRFPANFAVIAMCSPTSITASCLAGDSNIKLDGNNTNLIVGTGDLGTNRWTKSGGNSSGVALGKDSNAYMELYDDCWNAGGNQCNLFGYSGGSVDTSDIRSALPLGAAIQDPAYAPPTIDGTTAPNECQGTGTVQLASVHVIEQPMPDIQLAAAVQPQTPAVQLGAPKIDISGTISTAVAPITAVYAGVTVKLMNGATLVDTTTTSGTGAYTFNNENAGTYSIDVIDNTATGAYVSTTLAAQSYSANTTNNNISVNVYPKVTGWVRNASTSANISGATVTISALGTNYVATTDASGNYTRYVRASGALVSFSLSVVAAGYVNGSSTVPVPTANDTQYTQNFSLTPVPASLTGTITDAVTGLVVPGVIVTLSTGETATTSTSGVYTIASTTQGTKTVTLSGTAIVGTSGYSFSTPASGGNVSVVGATTQNYTVWPKGCATSGSAGNWNCSNPSGNNCPAPTNVSAGNVNCTFTQANAIRPGTYNNITLPNGTCAWLDPKGGATGLASGQSGGIYHIKGTLDIGNGSYLFGDGVTLIFDRNAGTNVGNSGGWVLNYGTHNTSNNATCNTATDFATPFGYGESGNFCFRTAGTIASNTTTATAQTEDRSYAAWTTKGHLLWTGTQSPTFSDDTVAKGSELGITFFFYCPPGTPQCGLGNKSRMKLSTANMGYLFNGVMYGPGDDIELGGGKDDQSAAGQLVGWTIEYHGGTKILQNWYGDPVDGQPFLIEPTLGE